MHTALIAPSLFDGVTRHGPSALLIEGETVHGRVPVSEVPSHYQQETLNRGVLTPGLLDLQVNGGGGVLLNNQPDAEALAAMASGHASAGVARILATLISDRLAVTEAGVMAAVEAAKDLHSGILGVHVEGPFFSQERNGVHHPNWLRRLDDADWVWLKQAAHVPAIITVAPEQIDPIDIQRMVALGLRVSAGHTNALHDEVRRALDAGLSGFTHLYNAMRPMTGREPGVVGTALADQDSWCGIIADGIHVHPTSVQLALHAKPRGKLYLVSDAMATLGASDKTFELYGEQIHEDNGRLVNAAGRLAGSAISLVDAVRYCVQTLNVSLDEAVAMASRYPAEYLGIDDRFGSLREGRVADISWFDDDLTVQGLWRAGKRLY
ncbi:N-acetylglucosamine-6-phosphate deacetylase [Saccharospirillum sp. MSK14-1]|uniref:N-acetylglucosamine-6-phosphate deacetylase n=1 Tax=Saccharospirillum sp. MSK14-1 TaxID=1897632 RepID=UPI000D3B3124|nr:N-acetylglucosamine-6-phosphate deacetylase [Saccharospirillum sp. MSK14-1]PTY38045.1 N-acetylglucosamine-6-phosphate deacetylase [Saccharospirillum sp. MSK14-1]